MNVKRSSGRGLVQVQSRTWILVRNVKYHLTNLHVVLWQEGESRPQQVTELLKEWT